jgi:hypothetical protein
MKMMFEMDFGYWEILWILTENAMGKSKVNGIIYLFKVLFSYPLSFL